MENWDDLRWFVVFNGIADAWLWGFDADGWQLRHGDPAMGTLGILPSPTRTAVATLDDALWLADVLAFDHDAPVGVQPAMDGVWPDAKPKDANAVPPSQPVQPNAIMDAFLHWSTLNQAYGVAAELRFNGSYVIRYDDDDADAPGTDFSVRFGEREELVALYAMAARQVDVLSEYLCLYRVLEAADARNGMTFSGQALPGLLGRDFGDLRVVGPDNEYATGLNAFDEYRDRARAELASLDAEGVGDIPGYLYGMRNSLAHGKTNTLHLRSGDRFGRAVRALPIVKLLARLAVEP